MSIAELQLRSGVANKTWRRAQRGYTGYWERVIETIHPQSVLFGNLNVAFEVNVMAHVGLLFLGLVIRTIFGAALVVALVWLFFKLAKLADAYTKKLQSK